ncbi:MAG TPA: aspartate-semialdehyde dehydrogenase [Fimbriimonadaceae bacterium]|nr:aspartate-semialdehyde dehydrogenase [Fimbriimonadaceae bacterium]
MSRGYSVAVVGATGAVGGEFLRLFEERGFPVSSLRLLASERSVGKKMAFKGQDLIVEEATPGAFAGVDLAFFSAGATRSKALVPAALAAGAAVFDNSSAFRMDPDVPLVVPEVNGDEVRPGQKMYAVPNCTAIILLVAVNPLRRLGKIDRLIVSTYQSASGGGAGMMRELESQTKAALDPSLEHSRNAAYPPYAFNLFSHNTAINEHGYNDEEWKVIKETRKILGLPDLRVNVTCVRVPVLRAHSETVTIEFAGDAPSEEAVREALSKAPGVRVVDDRANNRFPTPLDASGQGDVLVGRIRKDVSHPGAISMFIAGDQLLKGAALNAVQIAERYVEVSQPVGKAV